MSPETDAEIIASRATEPYYLRAPSPPDGPTPRLYQHAGCEYASRRKNVLIGDEPGVGKTAQAILRGNMIGAEHTLVICPASLRLNWEREIWAWSTIPGVSTYPILKSRDGVSIEANYVILSPELLKNKGIREAILEYHWDHFIFDECHKAKDYKGNQTTRALREIEPVVGHQTWMTGTPTPNQPMEVWNVFKFLDHDAINGASAEDFRDFYYEKGGGMIRGPVTKIRDDGSIYTTSELHWSNEVRNQPRNLDDLQRRLRKHIMVRRLKEQVLPQLPPKQWHVLPTAMTGEIKRALAHPGWKKAEKLYDMDPDSFSSAIEIDGAISTARRELGEAMAPVVGDYIEQMLDEGHEKLVVAAWHHGVLDYLRERFEPVGLAYMDGGTSSTRKQNEVDRFQHDPRVKIILGQMMPLGEGWTLTAAWNVVFAEADFVPGRMDQMLDRIHRLGQNSEKVIGHVPVPPGSLMEKIMGTAVQKARHIHATLDAA